MSSTRRAGWCWKQKSWNHPDTPDTHPHTCLCMYQSSIYSICTLALVHRYLNMWNIIYIYICTVYIYIHVYGYKRILCIVNTLLIITTQAYINTQYSTCCIERSSQESHFVPLIAALELPPCHFTPPTWIDSAIGKHRASPYQVVAGCDLTMEEAATSLGFQSLKHTYWNRLQIKMVALS